MALLARLAFVAVLVGCVSACSPKHLVDINDVGAERLLQSQYVAVDGAILPLTVWLPEGQSKLSAVVVAVHGFNDYRRAFDLPGAYLAQQGVAIYAYDQRGFGGTEQAGIWPGEQNLLQDLVRLVRLINLQYPEVPIYLLGDSMGGAVVALASLQSSMPDIHGLILSAPAVWGNRTFSVFHRMGLWLLAHTVPWMEVTGEGIKITVTDNIPLLKELSRDPLMIRETRIDALYGLVHMMDAALEAAPKLQHRTLVVYGLKDEVIPLLSVCHFVSQLDGVDKQTVFYEDGYHFLLRDLGAEKVWRDILAWMTHEQKADGLLDVERVCRESL